MNEFALECKYKYNCNYCSTKSSLSNLHENGVTSLWMNIIVSIAQQNLQENGVCQKVFVKQYLQLNSLLLFDRFN